MNYDVEIRDIEPIRVAFMRHKETGNDYEREPGQIHHRDYFPYQGGVKCQLFMFKI